MTKPSFPGPLKRKVLLFLLGRSQGAKGSVRHPTGVGEGARGRLAVETFWEGGNGKPCLSAPNVPLEIVRNGLQTAFPTPSDHFCNS